MQQFRTCFALAALAALVAVSAGGAAASPDVTTPAPAPATADFWSFQPISHPAPPPLKEDSSVRNPVDRFVLARLEREGLRPAPGADKQTLLRRATFDLTGLPPTPQEVRAFLADHSPDAYEKLIDRLLASPHYGERWGRHWLDVARYVQGRVTFPGVRNTLGDTAYRDYVVRAFNNDKPYDRFITEQIAGDLLPPSGDRRQQFDQICAPAFLSIGPWFDQCTDPNRLKLEIVDDMINTTTRAVLGLSVACARCHDHKFDPIPTSDYYALAGVFGSTKIVGDFSDYWRDGRQRLLRPLAMPDQVAANDALLATLARKKSERWQRLSDGRAAIMQAWRSKEAEYRDAAATLPQPFIKRFAAENFDGEHNLRIAQLALDGRSVDVIETLTPTDQWVKYVVEAPEPGKYELEALYSADEPTPVDVTVNGAVVAQSALNRPTGGWELIYQRWAAVCTCDLRRGFNFIRLQTRQGSFPRLDRFRLCKVDDTLSARVRSVAAALKLEAAVLGNFVKDPEQPWPTTADIAPYLSSDDRSFIAALDDQIETLNNTIQPFPTVVSVTDQRKPADSPIHLRGDVYEVSRNEVPRGRLTLFKNQLPTSDVPANESGRLQLAQWMTDRRNPLTARVIVNRLWQWHFGRGLVATTSDFGLRGSPPTHPELLDWLASELIDSGWSVKHVQRLILTSAVYRMSSRAADDAAARDPDNALLAHFNRNRLDVESMYDAMASTDNIIVRQDPGQPLDVEKDKNRAMYVLASNRSPKGLGPEVRKMFELFDYDSSGAPISVRPQSTTPAQSLFWLNSPLVQHFADKFAERLLKMDKLNDAKRVEMAYLLALGRTPTTAESGDAMAYLDACVEKQKMDRQAAWSSFCQALYGSVEFRYVE